mgnify:CR=1 FL=1
MMLGKRIQEGECPERPAGLMGMPPAVGSGEHEVGVVVVEEEEEEQQEHVLYCQPPPRKRRRNGLASAHADRLDGLRVSWLRYT